MYYHLRSVRIGCMRRSLMEKAEYDFGLLRDASVWDFDKRAKIWKRFLLDEKEVDYLFKLNSNRISPSINIHPKLSIASIETSILYPPGANSMESYLASLLHGRTFFPKNDDLLCYFAGFLDFPQVAVALIDKFVNNLLDDVQMDIVWRYSSLENRWVILSAQTPHMDNWMFMEAYVDFYQNEDLVSKITRLYAKQNNIDLRDFDNNFYQYCATVLGDDANPQELPKQWLMELLKNLHRNKDAIICR